MDGSIEPDVYVMTRAWFGVVPTGAQAAVAINLLAELFSSDYLSVIEVLSKDIYVDDINSGAELNLNLISRSFQHNQYCSREDLVSST